MKIKLFDKNHYSKKFYLLSGIGSAGIITLALGVTYQLWNMGVEQNIFTSHFSTSVMFTEQLAQAGNVAPWALISVNWLGCRTAIRKLRSWAKRRFE